ncbi:MAG: hypothetical protein ACHQJ5_06150 [Vicinamibacteria bacterium]|jgi:hypothetical protein
MQSNAARATVAGVLLVAVIVLFIVLKGGDDDSSTTTAPVASTTSGETTGGGQTNQPDSEIPTIVVKDGKPVGGVQDLEFTEGEEIRFTVDSDVSDEVHFHGYDIGKDVEAGGSVSFDVPATITGVFEVELESRVEQIAEITVNPS